SSGVAVSSASASSSDPILNEIRTELYELRGELLELRDREPVARDPMLDEIRAQLDRLTSAEAPARDPILDEIRAQLERVPSAESLVSTAVEQLRGALDEAIGAVHDGVARSVGELSLRLDSVEAKIVQVAGDTSDALDGAAAQTAGGLQDLRTALAALTETS